MTTAEQKIYNNGFILGMTSKGIVVKGSGATESNMYTLTYTRPSPPTAFVLEAVPPEYTLSYVPIEL